MTFPSATSTAKLAPSLDAMSAHHRARTTTWIAGLTLAVAWVWVAQAAWRQTLFSMHPWAMGDWAINLQGGLVRRGLLGELLYSAGLSAHAAGQVIIGTQLLLLACLYGSSFLLFLRTSRSPAWMMLLLSPAFTLFPLLSFDGGLRKELLTLVAASLLGMFVGRGSHPSWLVFPFFIYLAAVAGHETASLMLPVFLYLLWFGRSHGHLGQWTWRGWSIAFTLVAVAALTVALAFPGTSAQADAICRSWLSRGAAQEACTGSIAALGDEILNVVRQVSLQFPDYFSYVPLALLAALPFALLRAPKSVWILLGITYFALTPVLLTGIDYGRWIYLATAMTSILALTIRTKVVWQESRVPLLASVLYITMWSLPYTGPVTQTSLFTRIVAGPYHIFAVWLGRITGVS